MPVLPASEEAISQAARALALGEIVAFPTETVYGLGANARDANAVTKVFAAKERPRFNPLIVHVPDLAAAETYAVFDDTARKLAEAFWPGPLSLVLPKRPNAASPIWSPPASIRLRSARRTTRLRKLCSRQRGCPSPRPPPTGPDASARRPRSMWRRSLAIFRR